MRKELSKYDSVSEKVENEKSRVNKQEVIFKKDIKSTENLKKNMRDEFEEKEFKICEIGKDMFYFAEIYEKEK